MYVIFLYFVTSCELCFSREFVLLNTVKYTFTLPANVYILVSAYFAEIALGVVDASLP